MADTGGMMAGGEGTMAGMMGGHDGMMAKSWERGRSLAAARCAGCHGAEGMATSDDFPDLAGQDGMYLISALNAYRDGRRTAAPMNAMAAPLSKQDVHDLAM